MDFPDAKGWGSALKKGGNLQKTAPHFLLFTPLNFCYGKTRNVGYDTPSLIFQIALKSQPA